MNLKASLIMLTFLMWIPLYADYQVNVPDELGFVLSEQTSDLEAVGSWLSDEQDFSQLPGWPKAMGADPNIKPSRGLVFEDLNGDGKLEVIASSTDNKVYVWDYQGNLLPGWPKTLIGMAQEAPSVGDIDNDGKPEIVQGTRGLTEGGRLYALEANGAVMPGFPLNMNNNNISSSVTLADLDGDNDLELIFAERAYPIGYLHVYHHNGVAFGASWPHTLDHVPTGTPAVGDINNDGFPEIIHMSYTSIYAYDRNGNVLPGWPQSWYPSRRFSYQSPALSDINEDGYLDIAVATHGDAPALFVLKYDGTVLTGFPKALDRWSYSPPTIADLDGDGHLDVLVGQSGIFGMAAYNLFAYNRFGNSLPGWPILTDCSTEGPIIVADIDGDGLMEVIFDSNLMETASGNGYLHAVNHNGTTVPGFPLRPAGFTYMNGSTVDDINGDGIIEVATVSYYVSASVSIWSLESPYRPELVQWKVYHADNEHTGLYHAPSGGQEVTVNAEPEYQTVKKGGTCKYDISIANLTSTSKTISGYINAYLPSGKPYPGNPFYGPVTLTLAPSQTVKLSRAFRAPASAAAGKYKLDFVVEDAQTVLKILDHDEVILEITN